jgi:hypothetical protein
MLYGGDFMYDKVIILAVIVAVCVLAYMRYKNYFGLLICGTGAFFNLLAIVSNGFRMPVKTDSVYDYINIANNLSQKYAVLDEGSNFKFLSDVFAINGWIFSLGDIVIFMRMLLTLLNMAKDIRDSKKEVLV